MKATYQPHPHSAGQGLGIWVVYCRPTDYPAQWVARRHVVLPGRTIATDDVILADNLEALRAMLPPGLYRLARWLADDPHIVECWL